MGVPSAAPCGCAHNAPFQSVRSRQLLTAGGPVRFDRAYNDCPRWRQGQVPRDRELDIVDTGYSPAVRRMMALVRSETSFAQGRAQMALLAGLLVTRKAVERRETDGQFAWRQREDSHLPHRVRCSGGASG